MKLAQNSHVNQFSDYFSDNWYVNTGFLSYMFSFLHIGIYFQGSKIQASSRPRQPKNK